MCSNTTGTCNTAIGTCALSANTTGVNNIALGYFAGNNITSGDGNVVIGNGDVASATGDKQLKISDGVDGSVVWLTGDSSGNIGIKQTSPTAGLHIGGNGTDAGSFKVNASDNSEWFKVEAGTVSFNMQGGSTKVAGATSLGARMNIAQLNSGTAALALAGGQANNILEINSANSDLGGDYLVVNQTGKVGIGTTAPSQALDVVGSIEVSDGIYLGGTGTANKLDDYEEGTFTPGYGGTTGSTGSLAYNTQTGRYTKVGNKVFATGEIRLSNKGSFTGVVRVSGLPFAPLSGAVEKNLGSIVLGNVDFATGVVGFNGILASGSNFYINKTTDNAVEAELNTSNVTNTSNFYFNFTYTTA